MPADLKKRKFKVLKRVLLAILATFIFACSYIYFFVDDFTVVISEAQVQAALDSRIKEESIGRFGVRLDVKKAKIDFRNDDVAIIQTEFSASSLGYSGQVIGEFQSGIRLSEPYIYLNNIKALSVNVETDDDAKNELSEIKNAARKFLERQRRNSQSPESKEFFDEIVGNSEDDFQKSIVRATYQFFERIPIYNLNKAGYKGRLASLALTGVVFFEDTATLTLSPKLALIKILTMAFFSLLFIVYLWFEFVPLSFTLKILRIKRPDSSNQS